MKQGIHPQYVECTVTCSCGNTFKTHATVSEMRVELCNECHPFYTGQQKFVDTGGRVQRFADKFGGAAAAQLKKAEEAKAAKAAKAAEAEAARKAAAEAKAAEKAKRAAKFAEEAAKQAAEAPAEAPVEEVAAEAETTEAAEKIALRGIARIHGKRAVHPIGCTALFLSTQSSTPSLHRTVGIFRLPR